MRKFRQIFLFFLISCLLPACAPKIPPPKIPPLPPLGEVSDLRVLPQRVEHYVQESSGAIRLLTDEQQQSLAARFLEQHFAPWDKGFDTRTDSDPFWGLKQYQGRLFYGENLLPLPADWLKEMARQSAVESYPALMQPAVTVVTTGLRVLPTHKPIFNASTSAGQGFPFDMLQNSLVPAGTPVLVVHASLDGSWYLVKTPHVSGWVRPWEVAWVDQAFMDAYRSTDLIGFTADNVPAYTSRGAFVLHGRVGMLLPRSLSPAPPPDMIAALAPLRRADGWAELETILVPSQQVVLWPMAATPDNFSRVLNGLLGQPYGWGGMFKNRDCSALIQDLYALFGLSLPRNSRAQARAGRIIDLENLGAQQKEKHILEHGVPLLTIVNMPGHVMLYLGPDPVSGRPVVLHSIWGLRIQTPECKNRFSTTPGRWVLGRTVITTLTPGQELPFLVQPEGLLVERVSSLTILGE